MEEPTLEEIKKIVRFERDANGKLCVEVVIGDVVSVQGDVLEYVRGNVGCVWENVRHIHGSVGIVGENVGWVDGKVGVIIGDDLRPNLLTKLKK